MKRARAPGCVAGLLQAAVSAAPGSHDTFDGPDPEIDLDEVRGGKRVVEWSVEDGEDTWQVVGEFNVPLRRGIRDVSVTCNCPASALLQGLCEHARASLLSIAEDHPTPVYVVSTYICSAEESAGEVSEPIRCNSETKGVFDTYEGALAYVNDDLFGSEFSKYEWEYVDYDKCWHAYIEDQESKLVYQSADRCVKIEAHWLRNDTSDVNCGDGDDEATLGEGGKSGGGGGSENGGDEEAEVEFVDLTS